MGARADKAARLQVVLRIIVQHYGVDVINGILSEQSGADDNSIEGHGNEIIVREIRDAARMEPIPEYESRLLEYLQGVRSDVRLYPINIL